MSNDLIVRVLGETTQFEKSLKRATATQTAFDRTLKKSAITAEQAAGAQVNASLKKDARLREEIALYRRIAAAAEKGSREQVVAANLAERGERQLARSMGVTAIEARKLSSNTQHFERDLSRATRGAVAGSGIFRGLGRSLAFASGGFLAFGGVTAFLRKSIDASKEAAVAEAQLGQQFQNTGRDVEQFQGRIDKASNSLSASSGFNNDEIKAALTTILRTQPNVSKALRDTATAADLARARHIGLAQASLVVAKVEGGNTKLLQRQLGIRVKSGHVEEALAILRERVAGQARAGATEQERFGAILHNTEEIIGTGVLPTLNEYLARGGVWLTQMNESGKLQRDVAAGAHGIETAVSAASTAIHDIDAVTGSFKNTLELLLALKIGSVVTGWAGSFAYAATQEGKASKEAKILQTRLSLLPAVVGVAVVVEIVMHRKQIDDFMANVRKRFVEAQQHARPIQLLAQGEAAAANAPGVKQVLRLIGVKNVTAASLLKPLDESIPRLGQHLKDAGRAAVTWGDLTAEASAKAAHGLGLAAAAAGDASIATTRALNITAAQRNTFFDNSIARILLRGGVGDINTQIAALQQADARIQARIKATKDVTRRLNLEDELIQNEAQIRSLRAQASDAAASAAASALQKRHDAFDEFLAGLELGVTRAQATARLSDDVAALQALQAGIQKEIVEFGKTAELAGRLFDVRQQLAAARASQVTGRQFAALGLGPTGDAKIPGVRALRRALGNVQDEIVGSSLDTKKTRSLLAAIRRVLSGGLGAVGEEVRAKIQKILGDLNRQLDDSTQKNLTKWRHLSSQAVLAGVPDLTPAQRRALALRLSVLGPGGSVPPRHTQAFALAGGRTTSTTAAGDVYMDGEKVGTITKGHQIRRGRKRTVPRSG